MTTVRPAAVAGSFYPSAAQQLGAAVAGHLSAAPESAKSGVDRPPKMLVVPHAGNVYSGDVAALA